MSRRVLVAGATGLVGRALQEVLLAHGGYEVTALVRKPLGLGAPRLNELTCDFAALAKTVLPEADMAFCCLGTTLKVAGSSEAFRRVDFDFALNFARAAKKSGASRFALLSAAGASATSRILYSRVKADIEAAVTALEFEHLLIARPSLLIGDRERLGQPSRPIESLARRLIGPVSSIVPASFRPIRADDLARAMLRLLTTTADSRLVAENALLLATGAPNAAGPWSAPARV
jgi:uncharacterized protein YbjT (DUF2867 family)